MYKIEVIERTGVCDNDLIEKMIQRGDITFIRLQDIVNEKIHVNGYIHYVGKYSQGGVEQSNEYVVIAIEQGYIRTGSLLFIESLKDYIKSGIFDYTIRQISCKKGYTFKAEPVLSLSE